MPAHGSKAISHLSREKGLHVSFPKQHAGTVWQTAGSGRSRLQTALAGCWTKPFVPSFTGGTGHPGPVGMWPRLCWVVRTHRGTRNQGPGLAARGHGSSCSPSLGGDSRQRAAAQAEGVSSSVAACVGLSLSIPKCAQL